MKKLSNAIMYRILMFILIGTQMGQISAGLRKLPLVNKAHMVNVVNKGQTIRSPEQVRLAQEQLFDGIRYADVSMVREALATGTNVNLQSSFGKLPLEWAVSPFRCFIIPEDILEIITELLKRGADINKRNDNGETSILVAIPKTIENFSRQLRIIQFLLKNGANVLIPDSKGITPFNKARHKLLNCSNPDDLDAWQDLVEVLKQAEQQQREMCKLTAPFGDDGAGVAPSDEMNC